MLINLDGSTLGELSWIPRVLVPHAQRYRITYSLDFIAKKIQFLPWTMSKTITNIEWKINIFQTLFWMKGMGSHTRMFPCPTCLHALSVMLEIAYMCKVCVHNLGLYSRVSSSEDRAHMHKLCLHVGSLPWVCIFRASGHDPTILSMETEMNEGLVSAIVATS